MKTTRLLRTAALLCLAGRLAADVQIEPSTISAGGGRITAAGVTIDATIGGIGGLVTNAGGSHVAKTGYAGQLYDRIGLAAYANPTSVNEGATSQLSAMGRCDDDTLVALTGTPAWSVVEGPLAWIDASGLAQTTNVYQNTPAVARAVEGGYTGTAALVVLNVGVDDYRSYAGDGIADDWQVGYFGEENPDARPGADYDHDTQTNFFEYIAGTVPTDPDSRFRLWIETVSGVSTQMDIVFDPAFWDRTYQVRYALDLQTGAWSNLTDYATSTEGTERTVRDLSATDAARFYRVGIQYGGAP